MALDLKGFIDKIIFRNADNGYTVFNLISSPNEIEITCVGTLMFINEGEYIEMEGVYIDHPIYGQQFQLESYEVKRPEDLLSMERYCWFWCNQRCRCCDGCKDCKIFSRRYISNY